MGLDRLGHCREKECSVTDPKVERCHENYVQVFYIDLCDKQIDNSRHWTTNNNGHCRTLLTAPRFGGHFHSSISITNIIPSKECPGVRNFVFNSVLSSELCRGLPQTFLMHQSNGDICGRKLWKQQVASQWRYHCIAKTLEIHAMQRQFNLAVLYVLITHLIYLSWRGVYGTQCGTIALNFQRKIADGR